MGCVLEELLLAFIQVKKCSQEGREQMAMDTTRLYNYATSLCDIQPADDAKDLKYVLDYVTCCKLDEPADVMAWIEKHHAEYGQDVIDSIVNYAMAKKLNKQKFMELKEKVGAFYAGEGESEKPKESRVCCKQGTAADDERPHLTPRQCSAWFSPIVDRRNDSYGHFHEDDVLLLSVLLGELLGNLSLPLRKRD